MSLLEARSGAGEQYVVRTEKPKIGEVEIKTAAKHLRFGRMRAAWESLSAEDQEKYMAEGNWQPDASAGEKKKARTH